MELELSGIRYTEGDFTLSIPRLHIANGEFFTLLGPSGCGKSTTLRLISGLLDGAQGTISLSGRQVQDLPPEKRNIGMVFQDLALFPHYTVEGNIGYGIHRTGKADARDRIDRLLHTISLEGFKSRHVDTLSGGEQQRVAIARSLAAQPGLLLLDEPLSALDANMRTLMRREIKRLHRELKFTCLYVTHDQEEALGLSDRIGVMFGGSLVQTGTPEELFTAPGSPQVAGFLGYANSLPGEKPGWSCYARPDACRIGAPPAPAPGNEGETLTVEGVIEFSEYTGNAYRCGARTEHGLLEGISDRKRGTGEPCVITIPRDKTICFPPDTGGAPTGS
ncbi:MAG: ABC transporter ATP-binding protein [Spirochaetales bacterium]|nr:ABC transporter ATP-binding protein [Spirochaetales bacterium]